MRGFVDIVHPELGLSGRVPESTVRIHRRAGWVPADEAHERPNPFPGDGDNENPEEEF